MFKETTIQNFIRTSSFFGLLKPAVSLLKTCRIKTLTMYPGRGRGLMLRPLRPTSGIMRLLRLKLGMLRLCATEEILRDFVQPKEDMLRLCANQIRYVAVLRDPNKVCCDHCDSDGYVATLCDRNICATLRDSKQICCDYTRPKKVRCDHWDSNGYVVTLGNRNICATLRGSKQICCDFTRPKKVRCDHCNSKWVCCDFARSKLRMLRLCATQASDMLRLYENQKCTLRPLRLKMGMLRLCATQMRHVATLCDSSFLRDDGISVAI